MAFDSVCSPENRLKIVHSLDWYVAPLGEESLDRMHNHYFAFKGDRTRCSTPPLQFQICAFLLIKYKVPLLGSTVRHFGTPSHTNIIPINGFELEEEVPCSILLPHK